MAFISLFFLLVLSFIPGCQTTTAVPAGGNGATVNPGTNVPDNSVPAATVTGGGLPTPTIAPPVVVEGVATNTAATPAAVQATATIFIEGLIGPNNFPPNVNPLTGEVVADPAVLARRPLAIKISNAPAIVRPQSGLNNADLVFEHYAEGGLTRFTAVFYSKDAGAVGSIRSGRLIDLEIPEMYDAAFAYSGASGPVRLMFGDSEFFDRIISPDFGHGGFFRVEDPNKAFEHTLFTNTGDLRFILDQRGQNTPPRFNSNMAFSAQPLTSGTPASRLEIGYTGTYVTWAYDSGSGRYSRWTDGQPHTDASTGAQLNFKNIIVLSAHHEETDILEDNVGGGHYSIQIQVWGEGPVSIFRDGQRFDGRWRREDPSQMLTFYDSEGNILPLAVGNTFFQLVPLGFDRLIVTP
jgi:hypothetical protein